MSATAPATVSTVSAVIADAIAEHTDEVFALMGNGNAYLTDALARAGRVRMTGVRHEVATVASADAYQRVTRRIACATTTYGPGFTNTLTGLADAAAARIPLVLVVGAEPSTGPRPWDVNQKALATACGALSLTVTGEDAYSVTREAFALAEARRLPVVLNIPFDVAAAPFTGERATAEPLTTPQLTPVEHQEAARVAALLSAAERPLIVAGRGARHAAAELGDLADAVGALTATSAPARGTFAGREWDLGVCGGFASEASSALIASADVVLVVGAGLNQFTTAFGDQFAGAISVVQIDIAESATNGLVTDFVRADAREGVIHIASAVAAAHTGPRWGGAANHAKDSRLNFEREAGTGLAADGRLDPRSAMIELNQILPQNRQIISDGGHFIGWSSYYFDVPGPDALTLVGTHSQSIGLGFPSAPGAIVATPEATHVLVTGDGGGLMGLADLESVVRTSASAAVIVFNDACYGAEVHQYGARGLDEAIMRLGEADFARLGEGVGATGIVVKTMADLDRVREWVAAGARGTVVIDLRITSTVVAPYMEEIVRKTLAK